jgi:sugar lactone lactonase YvrE
VRGLYRLSRTGKRPYRPALTSAPTAWTVAVRLMGPTAKSPSGATIGGALNGPGLVAFDSDGDAWIANNYQWNADPFEAVCAGKKVFELDPTVTGPAVLTKSLKGYRADQLWGAGFGIAVDRADRVWVGNFGFQGEGIVRDEGCKLPPQPPPARSVSLFGPDGKALSPSVQENPVSGGFTQGNMQGPQGMLTDRRGNLWIASCGNRSVVRYPGGDPDRAVNIAPQGLQEPFGLWLDGDRNAWVTSNQTGQVYAFGPDGGQLPGSPFGRDGELRRSMGIVVDSKGNKWVSNSTWVSAPCGDFRGSPLDNIERGFVTLLETDGPRGALTQYRADSLVNPWGIAVDGQDHVFVANFGGERLAELCGVQTRTCPAGHEKGDPIGREGYPYDGLDRNTGVSIDNSGNVWLANNWLEVPIQTNPGGKAVVVYFGLAEPIQTPAFGPPVPVLPPSAR